MGLKASIPLAVVAICSGCSGCLAVPSRPRIAASDELKMYTQEFRSIFYPFVYLFSFLSLEL